MTAPWSLEGAELVADYLAQRTGLVFAPHRRAELERGLRSLCARSTTPDARQLLERLKTQPELFERLLDEVTVGETYFFRDPVHFEFIRREVLPEILALRGSGHGVRAWSAGCASGEEPYSLAILLSEHGLLSSASLLGTDLSRAAVERAREASYRAWSLRNVDPQVMAPYFDVVGGVYRVRPAIREHVEFETLNLAELPFLSLLDKTSRLDLILCRNVFIYLRPETIRRISERFFDALAPGGYLLLGPSDPMLPDERFEILTRPGGVFYRRPVMEAARPPSPPSSEVAKRAPAPAPRSRPLAPRPSHPEPAARAAVVPEFDEERALLDIRALANRSGAASAEHACREALGAAPLSVGLHYAMGLLLLELGDWDGAIAALRRVLYLDPSLAIAHFTLAQLLARAGDLRGAERSYRNAEQCASESGADHALPLSDGVTAGGLARAARLELASASATTATKGLER